MVEAIELCEDLNGALKSRRRSHEQLAQISNNLHRKLVVGSRNLRRLRRGESGDVYKLFDNLWASSGVTLTSSEHFQDLLGQDNWEEHVDEMRRLVSGDHGIKLTCSYILDKLHHFIETGSGGELNVPQETVRERAEDIEEE